ncbi:MAG: energy-coupling factor transporter transmembrane component T family protein [Eggerthellaceae bacterium]
MQFKVTTYIPGQTYVHKLDTRIKLVLLLAYTITLFCVSTWPGIGICLLVCLCIGFASHLPLSYISKLLIPIYIIVAFTILFNAFSFDVNAYSTVATGLGNISDAQGANFAPIALIGSFGFVPQGFLRGCFYALRIILLVVASFLVCLTSTSTAITDACNSFLKPLRVFHVPSDDIATVFSIALRFIPITAEELVRIRNAQWTRGGKFDSEKLAEKLSAWQTVLIPLFVDLFRRADVLAQGMDARCYGASPNRSQLEIMPLSAISVITLILGLAFCLALSIFL